LITIPKYNNQIFIFDFTGGIVDWNGLKIFIAVAHNRTLVAAAASLDTSHSTVYRRLNEFEAQVGRLFERLNGIYELTELGEEMLIHAQRITHSFNDIERHIAGKDTQLKGIVRITAPTSFSYNYLPDHLLRLKELYPNIQVELIVTNDELNMSNRLADIAIRVTTSPPEHLVGREIRRIKWGAYASTEYISKHGKPTCLKDVKNHRLIGATGTLRSHRTFSWLDNNYALNIDHRSDDFIAMSIFAEKGLGLAFLPDELARKGIKRLFTFENERDNQLWILTHPDLRKIERIKVVMRYLATALAES